MYILNLLRSLLLFSWPQEAIATFKSCGDTSAQSYEVLCSSAECHNLLEQYSISEQICTQAISVCPDKYMAYNIRGFARYKLEQYSQSADDLKTAIAYGDINTETLKLQLCAITKYADVLIKENNPKLALQKYDEVLNLNTRAINISTSTTILRPNARANLYFNRAVALLALDRMNDAIESMRSAIAFNNNHIQSLAALGLLLIQKLSNNMSNNNNNHNTSSAVSNSNTNQGSHHQINPLKEAEEAVRYLTAAHMALPTDCTIAYNLGVALHRQQKLGGPGGALEMFRSILLIDPNHASAKAAITLLEEEELRKGRRGSKKLSTSTSPSNNVGEATLDREVSSESTISGTTTASTSSITSPIRPTPMAMPVSTLSLTPSSSARSSLIASDPTIKSNVNITVGTNIANHGQESINRSVVPTVASSSSLLPVNPTVSQLPTETNANTNTNVKAESNENSNSTLIYPYSALKAPGPYPPNIDTTIRESYLSEEEFESVFKMCREDYDEEPKWKKIALKKKLGLF